MPVPRALRACVVGAGPAGLYASKFLAENGMEVRLFEKDERILGKYRYSRDGRNGSFEEVISNPMVQLNLNVHSSQIQDKDCDFYVCATGGTERELSVKGKELPIKAMDIIRRYYDQSGSKSNWATGIGDKVCIIGMGNVTMDLVNYMQGKCNEVTVLSRSNLSNAAFDNHRMREIVESGQWNLKVVDEFPPIKDRKTLRRYAMLLPFCRHTVLHAVRHRIWTALSAFFYRTRLPTLSLVFGADVESIEKVGSSGGVRVRYGVGGSLKEQVFDSVISSIGFVPNVPDIKTEKPIYYLGWCATPRGSITDSKRDAELAVEKILSIHSPGKLDMGDAMP